MSFFHGIGFSEVSTPITAATQISNDLIVAVGTAAKSVDKPQLIHNFNEYQETFGYTGENSLDEVAQVVFNLYSLSPCVFINVLDKSKHFNEVEKEFEGVTIFKLSGNVDSDTVKITTGEKIPATELVADEDFSVNLNETVDEDTGETDTSKTFRLLKLDNVTDNKVKITYRLTSTALGGDAIVTETALTLTDVFELPADTILESVTAQSGGVDTLKDVGFVLEGDTVSLFLGAQIVDGKVKATYHEIDAEKVTSEDIVQALDKIDSTYARFTLTPGIFIAPKFSLDNEVAAALAAKAKTLDCVAINDIDAESYTAAIEYKNTHRISHSHLITCFPKVSLGGAEYYLSTHLAALMNVTDADNDNIPYVSPSNKNLQIDGAVINGKEIFLTQDQANLLNAAGIVTAFSFAGWKFWGNMMSVYPSSTDVKDIFISTRRMMNWLKQYLCVNYFSTLDIPISVRVVDSLLQSINLWMASLVSRGILLGGEVTFDESENPVTDLLAGRITFNIRFASPTPAQEITFKLTYDPTYFETLFQ